jgi:hypothetical protein
MDVGVDELDRRQRLDVLGARRMATRHDDTRIGAAEALDQFLAQHGTDETAATENQHIGHVEKEAVRCVGYGRSRLGWTAGSAGPIARPMRGFSAVPGSPITAA